jgi:hypothetical protein
MLLLATPTLSRGNIIYLDGSAEALRKGLISTADLYILPNAQTTHSREQIIDGRDDTWFSLFMLDSNRTTNRDIVKVVL